MKNTYLSITLLTISFLNSFAQDFSSKQDSLCCECFYVDTVELKKTIYYSPILNSLDPSYLFKITSLSENVDINKYEKFFYIMSLDKELKFQTSKIIHYLEGSTDSISSQLITELNVFQNFLKNKIQALNRYTGSCKELETIRKYLKKKSLSTLIDQYYFSQFITLTNIINEQDFLDYDEIIKFEQLFNEKVKLLLLRKQTIVTDRSSISEKESLTLLAELHQESSNRITNFTNEKINFEKVPKVYSKERLEQLKARFILREIIKNGDTIAFHKNKMDLIRSFQTRPKPAVKDSIVIKEDSVKFYVVADDEERKLTCVDMVYGLFLSFQIGSYTSIFAYEDLQFEKNIYFKKASDGKIASKETYEKIEKELIDKGITQYKLVAYNNGEFFEVEQAKRILLK